MPHHPLGCLPDDPPHFMSRNRAVVDACSYLEKEPSGDPFKVALALAQGPSATQGLAARFKGGENVAGYNVPRQDYRDRFPKT